MINFIKIKKVNVYKKPQWVYDVCTKDNKKFFVKHPSSKEHYLVHNTSMYPSIMRSLKISPETFLCKVQSNYDDIVKNIRPYLIHGKNKHIENSVYEVKFFNKSIRRLSLKDLKNWLDSIKRANNCPLTMAPNGSIFKYSDDAIIPNIQENLAVMRNIYKTGKKISGILKSRMEELLNEKYK